MIRKLFILVIFIMAFLPLSSFAFFYEYEGQNICYNIIDEESKTCETSYNSTLSGDVILPMYPKYGDTEYTLISIGNSSFGDSKIISLVIPNSVTSIGDYAFKECSRLKTINFGEAVTSIGWSAFK